MPECGLQDIRPLGHQQRNFSESLIRSFSQRVKGEHWQGRDEEELLSFTTGFLFEESVGKSSLISVPSGSSGIVYKGQRQKVWREFFVTFERAGGV